MAKVLHSIEKLFYLSFHSIIYFFSQKEKSLNAPLVRRKGDGTFCISAQQFCGEK
jgi:hypothetical protein